MKDRQRTANSESVITIEKEPELADDQNQADSTTAFANKKYSYRLDMSDEFTTLLAKRRSWESDSPSTERPVKIIPYFGSLPNSIGSDGDFYVDEMTNMLYGPKTDGVWPEDGVSAAGLCKRTFITLTGSRTAHVSPARSEGRIRVWLRSMLRFLLPNGFSKALSLRTSR